MTQFLEVDRIYNGYPNKTLFNFKDISSLVITDNCICIYLFSDNKRCEVHSTEKVDVKTIYAEIKKQIASGENLISIPDIIKKFENEADEKYKYFHVALNDRSINADKGFKYSYIKLKKDEPFTEKIAKELILEEDKDLDEISIVSHSSASKREYEISKIEGAF